MSEIEIRPLSSHEDYAACVELQRDTWGRSFSDTVPASILMVAQKLGGVAVGAFEATGERRLIGFVFGMTGVDAGEIVHWSDMLAVRPEARGRGIGRRLKEYQRRSVAGIGARVVYWTYDPLVSRNAHLNFNVFGVRAVEYVRNMYGTETGSELHRGIGTDRLIVAWPVDDGELEERRREIASARGDDRLQGAPIIGDADAPDEPPEEALRGRRLRIAIPLDIGRLQRDQAERAARWRVTTRAAFDAALRAGFRIDGVQVDAASERAFYLLRHRQRVST